MINIKNRSFALVDLCTGKRNVWIETLPNYWLYTKIDETYDNLGRCLDFYTITENISIYIFCRKEISLFYRWLYVLSIEYIQPTTVKCV